MLEKPIIKYYTEVEKQWRREEPTKDEEQNTMQQNS